MTPESGKILIMLQRKKEKIVIVSRCVNECNVDIKFKMEPFFSFKKDKKTGLLTNINWGVISLQLHEFTPVTERQFSKRPEESVKRSGTKNL